MSQTFHINDDKEERYNGFLQFLGTLSQHDENRVAVHIPSKIWTFYDLNDRMRVYLPIVWLRDQDGDYFAEEIVANGMYPIRAKSSGRLVIDSDMISEDHVGDIVEVTIRYVKKNHSELIHA